MKKLFGYEVQEIVDPSVVATENKLAGLDANGSLTNSGLTISDVATLSTQNQTFTGVKTINAEWHIGDNQKLYFNDPARTGIYKTRIYAKDKYFIIDSGNSVISGTGIKVGSNSLFPSLPDATNDFVDLGNAGAKWRHFYISGKLNPITLSSPNRIVGLVIPDTSTWTDDKTIATTDDFSVVTTSGSQSVTANGSTLSFGSNAFNSTPIPTVPTNISAFNNDAGYITKSVNDLTYYTLSSSLASVATSGNYNDLSNKPSLGTAASKNTGTSAGNVPVLDTYGKLDSSVVPAIAITDTFVVSTEAAMLALNAEVGDICVRTDLSKSFILKVEGASTLSHWQELLTPTDAVQSVCGKTGVVVLSATDVGALPDDTVLFSGSYNDLSNKPDLSIYAQSANLAAVATSGSYNDLSNKPTIPAAQIQSDWNQSDNTKLDFIKNKPTLATVATSGSYTDLTNKPTIPAAQVNSDWNASSGVSQILNKPTLATVATSGSYNDLNNKLTAGSGINISSNAISVDSSVVALQTDLPVGTLDINFNGTATGTTQALSNIVVGSTTYTVSSGMTNPMTTAEDIIIGGSSGTPTRLQKGNNGEILRVNSSGSLAYGKNLPVLDCTGVSPTYPSAANTDGLIIVLCSAEPQTKYDGYLYVVASSNNSQNTPSGYQVTVTNNYPSSMTFYDGQDSSGTSLGTLANSASATYTVTSGYICGSAAQGGFSTTSSGGINPYQITSDVSLYFNNAGGGSN